MSGVFLDAHGFEVPDPALYEQFNAVIYTDGSCSSRDRTGGWAWCSIDASGNIVEYSSGHAVNTTISRMELVAAVQALHAHQLGKVVIFSDSQYTVNAIGTWAEGWARKGWQTSVGRSVEHRDLIEMGWRILKSSGSSIRWVRGHRRTLGNLRADELAGQARAKAVLQSIETSFRDVEDVDTGQYL